MKPLDRKALERFLRAAADSLSGDWVLIGGTVLPLLGVDYRSTVDIDLIGLDEMGGKSNSGQLELMRLAEKLGLPVETINQAGALFLHRIPGFKKQLILLRQGKKAKIFRPNLQLFIRLKIPRLNESDLEDCLRFLKLAEKEGDTGDKKHLLALVRKEMKKEISVERRERLEVLLRGIG